MQDTPFHSETYRVQIAQGKAYEELGPLSLEELQLLAEKGMLQEQSLYFDEKEQSWKSLPYNAPLFARLFSKAAALEDTYEVLFPKADKPALKEPKPLKEEELKHLYQQGVITPNSIVFDKDHKSWGPLRVYKKLYHKLSPPEPAKLSLPAASKALALRLAGPNASPIAAIALPREEGSSKDSISTASLHAKSVLPRINERSAQPGLLATGESSSLGLHSAEALAPTQQASMPPLTGGGTLPLPLPQSSAKESIYSALGQKQASPSLKILQGSIFHEITSVLDPYARGFMGLSCLLLSALLYHYHKDNWNFFWQSLSLNTALSLGIQHPFMSLLFCNTCLGLRILNLFQGIAKGVLRLSLGLVLGGGLGYATGFMQATSLEGRIGGVVVFASLGALASLPPGRFSFALARVSGLIVLGYLGFIYQALGYMAPLVLLSLGSVSLYLGLYAYPFYTGKTQHIVFLLLSMLALGQLCVLQFVF